METQTTEVAASSPAVSETFQAPTDAAANLEWRKTGETPAAAKPETKPKEDSTTSTKASEDNTSETAPASATGTKQERAKQPTAADRLTEVLADLKRAGLSPAELKTFKREAQKADAETTAKAPPEQTVKPADGLEAPVKPKQADYDTWEKYEAAKDQYTEDFAKYSAKLAVQEDRQARAIEAQQQTLRQKLTDAKARYGAETEPTVGEAVRSIINGEGVAPVVKAMLNESPVLVDVMYVLGSKPEELASFVELARTNPGAAIRKVALLEQLVEAELAKKPGDRSSSLPSAQETESTATERDASGKFVSQREEPPAKKKPAAPPPPEELNTRGSAPPDPIEAAVRNNDFAAFKAAEDRADIARRRGAS